VFVAFLISIVPFSHLAVMGKPCVGDFHGGPCIKSKYGDSCSISQDCKRCLEQRCASHCYCKRSGLRLGRSAPRAKGAIAISKAPAMQVAQSHSHAWVGRLRSGIPLPPPIQEPEYLNDDAWVKRLCTDIIQAADSVVLAFMCIDNAAVCAALTTRLSRRLSCQVEIFVCKTSHDGDMCRMQKSRLLSLVGLGATVRLVHGKSRSCQTRFHKKESIIDTSVLYIGSANCTENSYNNDEGVVRLMTKKVVLDALHSLAEPRFRSVAFVQSGQVA
jgi:phosphatidylserine/phosphatidylglycerophosphate/cardiolipin synthase-like enzyme